LNDLINKTNKILFDMGLVEKLRTYGETHIVGSYMTDTMAWNDIDIYISNEEMSLDRLYEISYYVLEVFRPCWYEAKQDELEDGKIVWFHGFETMIMGELWNIDLWFLDKGEIEVAEDYIKYVLNAIEKEPEIREHIINLKKELIGKGLYPNTYTSMSVYNAVIEHNVTTVEMFVELQSR